MAKIMGIANKTMPSKIVDISMDRMKFDAKLIRSETGHDEVKY